MDYAEPPTRLSKPPGDVASLWSAKSDQRPVRHKPLSVDGGPGSSNGATVATLAIALPRVPTDQARRSLESEDAQMRECIAGSMDEHHGSSRHSRVPRRQTRKPLPPDTR